MSSMSTTMNPLSGVKAENMDAPRPGMDGGYHRGSRVKRSGVLWIVGATFLGVLLLGVGFVVGYLVFNTEPTPQAPESPHTWAYTGAGGPANWGTIEGGKYSLCSTGTKQSPVNVIDASATIVAGTNPIVTNYTSLLNNAILDARSDHPGFKIVPKTPQASNVGLLVNGELFQLKQFHFHSPSEHTLNGKQYPLEMHMVHKSVQGNYAVIGYLFEEGAVDNAFLATFWNQMQKNYDPINGINLGNVMPGMASNYYRYQGSFTTPPCTEGVNWFVATQTQTVSESQVKAFVDYVHPNARPVQALNGRVVKKYTV